MKLDLDKYTEEISQLTLNNYRFSSFADFFDSPSKDGVIILRHDIDFCLKSALTIAKLDSRLNVKSNFFFQLRSPLYNLFSNYADRTIKDIHRLGHSVGLHYDFLFYGDDKFGALEEELALLKKLFPFIDQTTVSFHRSKLLLEELEAIELPNGIRHTYDPFLFDYLKYYSDSKGILKQLPSKTDSFLNGTSMQLLLHPIWWTQAGDSSTEKVRSFLIQNREEMIYHIKSTAISFKLENL